MSNNGSDNPSDEDRQDFRDNNNNQEGADTPAQPLRDATAAATKKSGIKPS